jgi:hypothetical protein
MNALPSPPGGPVPIRKRRWIWFFLVLVGLGAVGLTFPIVYNLGQQLTPEQVAQARQRWQEHGARDYDLDYQVRFDREEQADSYKVKVRDGKVVSVVRNNEVRLFEDAAALLLGLLCLGLERPDENFQQHTVEHFFKHIETTLREDSSAAKRNYATASFDSFDGHPTHYVHRVAGTGKRLEWTIKLTRPGLGR